jgi:hypothetical protein
MVKPKTKEEIKELQDKVKQQHENVLSGKQEYFFLDAIVTDEYGSIEYETPILKSRLTNKINKILPKGQRIKVRVPAINVSSWENFLASMLIIRKKEIRKNSVYVLFMSNDTVKIGRTKNFAQRKKTISKASGLDIKEYWHTPMINIKKASKIENMAHKHFKKYRNNGEFFSVDYKKACAYVKELLSFEDCNHAETD